jgi:hypothetical protein
MGDIMGRYRLGRRATGDRAVLLAWATTFKALWAQ